MVVDFVVVVDFVLVVVVVDFVVAVVEVDFVVVVVGVVGVHNESNTGMATVYLLPAFSC